jgi:hypothetical protein
MNSAILRVQHYVEFLFVMNQQAIQKGELQETLILSVKITLHQKASYLFLESAHSISDTLTTVAFLMYFSLIKIVLEEVSYFLNIFI